MAPARGPPRIRSAQIADQGRIKLWKVLRYASPVEIQHPTLIQRRFALVTRGILEARMATLFGTSQAIRLLQSGG